MNSILSHQPSLFLIMYSITLQGADDMAMDWKEVLDFALGIGITLNKVQDLGELLDLYKSFNQLRSMSRALEDKFCNITGDILLTPVVRDFRDEITSINYFMVKVKLIKWSGGKIGELNWAITHGLDLISLGT